MSTSKFSLSSTTKLPNGVLMPTIHLGVYMTSGRETSNAVTYALKAGYRGFDSAEWYANEREVGSAILAFLKSADNKDGLAREDVWFTTKLKTNSGYDATRSRIKRSIKESGLGYLDLYLIHSPYGGKTKRLECWRAVEDAIEEGEVRAGGVSNYGVKHVSPIHIYRLRQSQQRNSCKNSSTPDRKSHLPLTRSKSTPSTHEQILRHSARSTGSLSKLMHHWLEH
jgi:diketogulonate reductase-like aldo/keto reductase